MASTRYLARSAVAVVGAATLMATAASATATTDATKKGDGVRNVVYTDWTSDAEFATGAAEGTTASGGGLSIGSTVGTLDYTDPFGDGSSRQYEYARWTSPSVPLSFNATEAIPSWNADTPGGSWIQVNMRGVTEAGNTTKWYILGRWAARDNELHRTSVSAQGDDDGFVAIDTFVARDGHAWKSWQIELTLLRPVGSTDTPSVRSIGAMASQLPDDKKPEPSTPSGLVRTLDVPRYSQELHVGHYPEWDNGGEAWCSPTSTSMAMAYWDALPPASDYDWVEPDPHTDPWVDHAARHTFDYNYDGAGNWPYNTAYAATYGLDGFVTRLRSLNEAEQFIAAGIPLVVSASWKKNEVPGADYGTNGHLLLIVGFDAAGNPVMNDPFAHSNPEVRKTFGRAEFERVWLTHSGGVTYVMHPPDVPLPAAPAQPNW
ncbi:MAG: peptidase C39 family protein [Micromonosporaceae bacterium]